MNIFRSIKQKEENYEYLFSKIRNLIKKGYIFPYSAAHLEEIAKQEKNQFYLSLIELISQSNSLRVGDIPKQYAKELCENFLKLINSPYICNSDKKAYLTCYVTYKNIADNQDDNNPELCFETKLEKEKISKYYARVINDLDSTETAENGMINNLGRRNHNSREKNNLPDYLPTFEKTRKKYNIDNAKISRLRHSEVLNNKPFTDFLDDYFMERKINFREILSKFNQEHYYLEKMINHLFSAFEIIGYVQEKNNYSQTLRNYTHDISHAIYGNTANFFITNDDRFYRKLKTTYFILKISCEILTINEFLEFDFDSSPTIYL